VSTEAPNGTSASQSFNVSPTGGRKASPGPAKCDENTLDICTRGTHSAPSFADQSASTHSLRLSPRWDSCRLYQPVSMLHVQLETHIANGNAIDGKSSAPGVRSRTLWGMRASGSPWIPIRSRTRSTPSPPQATSASPAPRPHSQDQPAPPRSSTATAPQKESNSPLRDRSTSAATAPTHGISTSKRLASPSAPDGSPYQAKNSTTPRSPQTPPGSPPPQRAHHK